MNNVTAILVTYNSSSIIRQSLESLKQSKEISHVIVVDNHSSDDTCAIIQYEFPYVELIRNSSNEGFGRANNKALERTSTDYALLINPDAFLDEEALTKLLKAAATYPDCAILSPQLRNSDNSIFYSYRPDIFTYEKHLKRYRQDLPIEGDICSLSFISGACWLVNISLLRQVGFYDPRFFLYFEDDDLCIRCQKAGYSVIHAHDAYAMHKVSASSGIENDPMRSHMALIRKFKHLQYSRMQIQQKYFGNTAAYWLAISNSVYYLSYLLVCLLIGRKRRVFYYTARLLGILKFISGATDHPKGPK